MDNHIYASSTLGILKDIYSKTVSRLKDEGFELRSWNYNSPDFREIFRKNDKLSSYQCDKSWDIFFFYFSGFYATKWFTIEAVASKRELLSSTLSVSVFYQA